MNKKSDRAALAKLHTLYSGLPDQYKADEGVQTGTRTVARAEAFVDVFEIHPANRARSVAGIQ